MKLAGEFGTPYRPPSGGWPTVRTWLLGSFWQHSKDAENGIASFKNVTKVLDYHEPPNAAGINPYARVYPDEDWPTCTDGKPAGGCLESDDTPCAPWTMGDIVSTATHGTNAFTSDSPNVKNLSVCRKIGFKNVQAWKVWHGRFGFLSHDNSTCVPCHAAVLTPDQTKYLSLTMSGTIECVPAVPPGSEDDPGQGSYTATVSRSVAVGRYTGVVTVGSCSESLTSSGYPPGYGPGPEVLDQAKELSRVRLYCDGSLTVPSDSVIVSQFLIPILDGVDISGCEAEAIESNIRNNESIYVSVSWYAQDAELGWHKTTLTASIGLATPYTAAQVVADCDALLDEWDLTNDLQYPWRSDGFVMVGPLVTRNEVTVPVSPDQELACDYTDPSALVRDGSIVGSPLPAGYGPYFSFDHTNWRMCVGDTGQLFFKFAQGAWSGAATDPEVISGVEAHMEATDAQIPRCATQWTENYTASLPKPAGQLPGGGWQFADSAGCYRQKFAATFVPRPSHNYSRPCGPDRERLDDLTVQCITQSSAGSVTVRSAALYTSGDLVYVCNDSNNEDGFYTITKSGDTLSLTPKAEWPGVSNVIENCGEGIVGKVRWPTAPAICGRIEVSTATQNGENIDLVLADECHYLRVGDLVDFTAVPGLGANVSITAAVSATEFRVVGTLSGSYAGGGFIASNGAAAYKWHDEQWKGDYVYLEWEINNRDLGEYARLLACGQSPTEPRSRQAQWGMRQDVSGMTIEQQSCEWLPCNPFAMCISPNGEVFNNGITKPFPTLGIDGLYGTIWQATFIDCFTDPLYQTPHAPCDPNSNPEQPPVPRSPWVEGTDYPVRPLEEARSARAHIGAETAPALPADAAWDGHIATLAECDSDTEPTGLILNPPASLGYDNEGHGVPIEHETSWTIYLDQEAHVCAEGEFKDDYSDNGVRCP